MDRYGFQVITHEDNTEGVYYNNKLIGQVMRFEDGYYSFNFNRENNGWWSSYDLKLIAELLDDLNEPWNTEVKAYFDSIEVEDASDDEILPF